MKAEVKWPFETKVQEVVVKEQEGKRVEAAYDQSTLYTSVLLYAVL